MDCLHIAVSVVHRAVRHLQEFIGKRRCVIRRQCVSVHVYQEILLHAVIQFPVSRVHLHLVCNGQAFRHVQVILRLHGDGNVSDPLVDLFLRAGPGNVVVHDAGVWVHPGRFEIRFTVPGDKLSQPHALVDQVHLRPQIQQAVAGGCSGQADDPLDIRTHLPQCPPALALVVLEAGQLVDHHHVKGPLHIVFLQIVRKPLHVVPVDHVHIRLCLQGSGTLLRVTNHDGHPQEGSVLPGLTFFRPHRAGYPKRGNHQCLSNLKAVEHQIQNRRQGDGAFPESHFENQQGFRVFLKEVHAEILVFIQVTSFHALAPHQSVS